MGRKRKRRKLEASIPNPPAVAGGVSTQSLATSVAQNPPAVVGGISTQSFATSVAQNPSAVADVASNKPLATSVVSNPPAVAGVAHKKHITPLATLWTPPVPPTAVPATSVATLWTPPVPPAIPATSVATLWTPSVPPAIPATSVATLWTPPVPPTAIPATSVATLWAPPILPKVVSKVPTPIHLVTSIPPVKDMNRARTPSPLTASRSPVESAPVSPDAALSSIFGPPPRPKPAMSFTEWPSWDSSSPNTYKGLTERDTERETSNRWFREELENTKDPEMEEDENRDNLWPWP